MPFENMQPTALFNQQTMQTTRWPTRCCSTDT